MSKIGRNKDWCKKYEAAGTREKNKAIKQERDKKRISHFRIRIENGKGYQYKKINELARNSDKRIDNGKTPLQKEISVFRKLQNWLDEQAEIKKKEEEKLNK